MGGWADKGNRGRLRDPASNRLLILLLMTLPNVIASIAVADTAQLQSVKDNTLYEDPVGDSSNGAGSAMFTGRNSQTVNSVRRALVAFDIAAVIPAGSTIENVTMTLFNDAANASPQELSLHRLSASWGEGASAAGGGQGSGGPAAPGDATWLHRYFDADLWTTPGGDFAPAASSAAIVSGPGFYSWSSTSALVADVQGLLDQPAGNYGWLLLGNESEASSAKRFATREADDPFTRPMLNIEFTPVPEPASLFMLVIMLLLRPVRRAVQT